VLLDGAARDQLICVMLGAAEVAASLVRKRNDGRLSRSFFTAAVSRLQDEILTASDFVKLPCDNAVINASIPLSEKHAINASDAIVLQVALEEAAWLRADGDDLVLVAADQRLLKAARAEGLQTLDPETQTEADVEALLSA
jgi:predicted nucleic acid-binding protein